MDKKKGMKTKPVRKVFFNRLMDWIFDGLELSGIHVGSFISGIKVYAYADEHTPEGEMVRSTYFQMLQAVVIENTVIYPFAGSAFFVDIFVLLGIPWYARLETQAAVVFDVDGASIAARGTFRSMSAFLNAAAFQWASVFMGIFDRVISPWAHFVSCFAKRMTFFAKSNVIRGISGRLCPAVDVNQGIHVPVFQQFISRDVIMGRVQADIFGGKAKSIAPEIINGKEEVLAVMAACTGELHQQGEFDFQGVVPVAEHIQCMPEIPGIVVAVPTPFSIGVGVVPGTFAAVRAGAAAGREMPAERGGMGNHGCAIAGQGKVRGINQAEPDGREDCKDRENLLQCLFRVIRGGFPIHDISNDIPGGKCIWVFRLLQFSIGADYLFGFLAVFAGGKQEGSGIGIPRSQPETVHKVIIGSEGRKFLDGSTANEEGEGNGIGKHIPDP